MRTRPALFDLGDDVRLVLVDPLFRIFFVVLFIQGVALEPLFALTVATTNGVGILHVQTVLPKREGTALALYNLGFQFGPVATSPILGYLAEQSGWGSAFAASAVLALTSAIVFLASQGQVAFGRRSQASRTTSGRPELG